jgi:hypothetical protein
VSSNISTTQRLNQIKLNSKKNLNLKKENEEKDKQMHKTINTKATSNDKPCNSLRNLPNLEKTLVGLQPDNITKYVPTPNTAKNKIQETIVKFEPQSRMILQIVKKKHSKTRGNIE